MFWKYVNHLNRKFFLNFRCYLIVKMFKHCVKNVQIQSFFWSVFPCIRPEYGDLRSKSKYGLQITPYLDTFHTVTAIL